MTIKRMVRFEGEGSLKAFFDVEHKGLLIKGFRVIEGKQKLFISMPRTPGKDGKWYDEVVILEPKVGQELEQLALAMYQEEAYQAV